LRAGREPSLGRPATTERQPGPQACKPGLSAHDSHPAKRAAKGLDLSARGCPAGDSPGAASMGRAVLHTRAIPAAGTGLQGSRERLGRVL